MSVRFEKLGEHGTSDFKRFVHLEKFSLNLSSSSFVICVNLSKSNCVRG